MAGDATTDEKAPESIPAALFSSTVGRFTVIFAILLAATAPGAGAVIAYQPCLLNGDLWKFLIVSWAVGGTCYGMNFFLAYSLAHRVGKLSRYKNIGLHAFLQHVSTGVYCVAGGLTMIVTVLVIFLRVLTDLYPHKYEDILGYKAPLGPRGAFVVVLILEVIIFAIIVLLGRKLDIFITDDTRLLPPRPPRRRKPVNPALGSPGSVIADDDDAIRT